MYTVVDYSISYWRQEMIKRYLRLPQVLERIPVSKSTWWAGVKNGTFPRPVKISARITVWSEQEIDEYVNSTFERARTARKGQA
jgi:prophage regulatory protein